MPKSNYQHPYAPPPCDTLDRPDCGCPFEEFEHRSVTVSIHADPGQPITAFAYDFDVGKDLEASTMEAAHDEAAAWIDSLLDSPAETPKPVEDPWLSIQSAPKDGTRIRVRRHMPPFGWITGTAYWQGGGLIAGWISRGDGVFGELGLAHPTQWKPIRQQAEPLASGPNAGTLYP